MDCEISIDQNQTDLKKILLTPIQIVDCFGKFRYVIIAIYLDIKFI